VIDIQPGQTVAPPNPCHRHRFWDRRTAPRRWSPRAGDGGPSGQRDLEQIALAAGPGRRAPGKPEPARPAARRSHRRHDLATGRGGAGRVLDACRHPRHAAGMTTDVGHADRASSGFPRRHARAPGLRGVRLHRLRESQGGGGIGDHAGGPHPAVPRAIEPRLGYWTLPAGISSSMNPRPRVRSVRPMRRPRPDRDRGAAGGLRHPRISQVQVIYRARLADPHVEPDPRAWRCGSSAGTRFPGTIWPSPPCTGPSVTSATGATPATTGPAQSTGQDRCGRVAGQPEAGCIGLPPPDHGRKQTQAASNAAAATGRDRMITTGTGHATSRLAWRLASRSAVALFWRCLRLARRRR